MITREEAKQLYTPKSTYPMKMRFINKIYDSFENQKCENCKHSVLKPDDNNGGVLRIAYCKLKVGVADFKDFGCNRWEQKNG